MSPVTRRTVRSVTKHVAIMALSRFDPALAKEGRRHVQREVEAMVDEVLESVLGSEDWSREAWPAGFAAQDELEGIWSAAIAQDFRLTFQLERPNDYVIHRLHCHALVMARAELALAIHLMECAGHDVSALIAYQSAGDHHGLKLARPDGAPAFCPLPATEVPAA